MGRLSASILCGLAWTMQAQATILTFDFGQAANVAFLPADYGDRIDQATVNGVSYPEGVGFTPNIVVDFNPAGSFDDYTVWNAGYASLDKALGHGAFNVPGELVFTPDPSYAVTLHDFDIATWAGGGYQTDIRIWDDSGSFAAPNLFSFNQLLSGNTVFSPLAAPVTGTGTLYLYINNLGSTGLDNLSFSQTPGPQTAIPLPAAMWLFAPALLLGLRRRAH